MAEAISDICLLVQDLDRAIEFYRDRVGFKLRRLAPGFADFFTAGVTLVSLQRRDQHQTRDVTPDLPAVPSLARTHSVSAPEPD